MSKPKRNSQVPLFLAIGGGILLVVAAILMATQNAPAAPMSSSAFDEETYPEIPRVSLEDAKAAFEAGTAVFVDVRGADVFVMSHIPGSLSIPLAELETRLTELDPNQWIITYCT
ncbi:MAG: rhodanese-like domain-containing protein [Anaerolineales bacterium]|nr:MAG: rhodanese-like domain-containing protein [Anaerolineales bacterium]